MRLLLCLLALALTVAGTDEVQKLESEFIEDFDDDGMTLVRLKKETYVAVTISDPNESFDFITEYAYEQLERYYKGWNYDHMLLPPTTPMFVELDIFDTQADRKAMFLVPELEEGKSTPAPRFPLYLTDEAETYYFVRQTDAQEFQALMDVAACMLTDLSYSALPFEGTRVYLALYDFPYKDEDEGEETPPNEIWVRRVVKPEDNGQCT